MRSLSIAFIIGLLAGSAVAEDLSATSLYILLITLLFADVKLSVIARGISVGDELEYTDELTLGRSIVNRVPFE